VPGIKHMSKYRRSQFDTDQHSDRKRLSSWSRAHFDAEVSAVSRQCYWPHVSGDEAARRKSAWVRWTISGVTVRPSCQFEWLRVVNSSRRLQNQTRLIRRVHFVRQLYLALEESCKKTDVEEVVDKIRLGYSTMWPSAFHPFVPSTRERLALCLNLGISRT
jgi:hypothetical protein